MKIKYGIILAIFALSLSACDEYLEKMEDYSLELPDVFKKRATTEAYLWNVYSFIPNERQDDMGSGSVICAATDEAFYCYANQAATSLNNGAWNVTSAPGDGTWVKMYQGIREANIFINALKNGWTPTDIIPADEQASMINEARFLRAYYYFILMRQYGPVILLGDEVMDLTATTTALIRERSSWDECVKYVCDELDAVVPLLESASEQSKQWYGKPTKGAALAVKARLLLYSARDLFNGNPDYKDYPDLFSATKDQSKWQKAADANKAVIDLGYQLVEKTDKDGNIDPYTSLYAMTTEAWNEELIWARRINWGYIQYASIPSGSGRQTAYGGISPTQEMVDAFAMKNGIYPIEGYNADGSPIIAPNSGYNENGFSDFTHPIEGVHPNLGGKTRTYNMYVSREPRFYTNVFWSGAEWVKGFSGAKKEALEFYKGGEHGIGTHNDYSKGGYMLRKYTDRERNHANNGYGSWGYITVPMFRLGEIYLNYIEALIEVNPNHPDIKLYWNKIRKRAGVPDIQVSYPNVLGNQAKMRELIRRERQVELAFEEHRFWDVRTWKKGEEWFGRQLHGMNYLAESDDEGSDFWKRIPVENHRVFKPKHHLYPMKQSELDRNSKLVQNPGW